MLTRFAEHFAPMLPVIAASFIGAAVALLGTNILLLTARSLAAKQR